MAETTPAQKRALNKKIAQVIAKAWADPKYKNRLKREPRKVLGEEGLAPPKGARVKVVENSATSLHFVLAHKPEGEITDKVAREHAAKAAFTIVCICL